MFPRGSNFYDRLSVIPVNTVKDMGTRVKSYIELEIAKEVRKTHKELKSRLKREKTQNNVHLSWGTKRHPILQRPRDIESLIQEGFLKNFMPWRRLSRSPC